MVLAGPPMATSDHRGAGWASGTITLRRERRAAPQDGGGASRGEAKATACDSGDSRGEWVLPTYNIR